MKQKKEYVISKVKGYDFMFELYKNDNVVKGQYGNAIEPILASEQQLEFIKQYLQQFKPNFKANKEHLTRQEINKAILRGLKSKFGGKNEN